MRTPVLILAALALVAAACGGSTADAEPGTTPQATVGESATSTTAGGSGSTEETTPPPDATTAPPAPDGPPAPDFALALADGSEFVLSAEQKPVYMVFWAEW